MIDLSGLERKWVLTRFWLAIVLALHVGYASADDATPAIPSRLDAREGEVRWLQVGPTQHPGLFKGQTAAQPRGAAIIIPDRGQGPDWPVMVEPLRQALPAHGWDTLSVAVPLTGMGRLARKTETRLQRADSVISAAIASFQDSALSSLYLIGSGWGGYAALSYLADNPGAQVTGLVLVDVPMVQELGTDLDTSTLLARIKVPVLDLYVERGERDGWQAQWRRQVMTGAGHPDYRQVQLDPVAMLPVDQEELVKRIRGWMQTQPGRGDTPPG